MKILLISVLLLLLAATSQAQTADLFISEYVEGSSNNKALEIYNGTVDSIQLSDYQLLRYSNGTTEATAIIFDAYVLSTGETFVLTNEFADPALLSLAQQTTSELNFNGDDTLVLVRGNLVVDSFGQVGTDPGSSWLCTGGTTVNQTLRRMSGICNGDADAEDTFDPCLEYGFFSQDSFDGLGSHITDCFSVSNDHLGWDAVKAQYR